MDKPERRIMIQHFAYLQDYMRLRKPEYEPPVDTKMKIKEHSLLITAAWILPVSGPAIAHGAILLSPRVSPNANLQSELSLSIEWVGPLNELSETIRKELADTTIDYGESLITPGLINLHTHLDYSLLQGSDCHSRLFRWMRNLIESSSSWTAPDWEKSASYGARMAAESGTTCLVDSSFSGNSVIPLMKTGLRAIVALELFGSSEAHADFIWKQWLEKYEKFASLKNTFKSPEFLTLTVAPHAPYTVSPKLWKYAQKWAQQNNLPLTAHIAESQQECQWIESNNDELDNYLAFIRALYAGGSQSLKEYDYLKEVRDTSWKGKGHTPVAHLNSHQLLDDNLLAVHMVHPTNEDLLLLQEAKVAIAHCPRSNSRLRNGRAPVENFISMALPFGLGTDSLASTDDLDLRQEVKTAMLIHRAQSPDFEFDDFNALRACTLDAAKIIGMESLIGSIESGKEADLTVFQLKNKTDRPEAALFHGDAKVQDVYVGGRRIVRDGVASLT
jgi:cytosine/adenosine deaminase-related metal-dependent hydrolase